MIYYNYDILCTTDDGFAYHLKWARVPPFENPWSSLILERNPQVIIDIILINDACSSDIIWKSRCFTRLQIENIGWDCSDLSDFFLEEIAYIPCLMILMFNMSFMFPCNKLHNISNQKWNRYSCNSCSTKKNIKKNCPPTLPTL